MYLFLTLNMWITRYQADKYFIVPSFVFFFIFFFFQEANAQHFVQDMAIWQLYFIKKNIVKRLLMLQFCVRRVNACTSFHASKVLCKNKKLLIRGSI